MVILPKLQNWLHPPTLSIFPFLITLPLLSSAYIPWVSSYTNRTDHPLQIRMGILHGVTKTILQPGNGRDSPKKGDTVIIEYRGCLYDESSGADHYFMGTQYVRLDEVKWKRKRMKSARVSDLVHFIIYSIGSIHRRAGARWRRRLVLERLSLVGFNLVIYMFVASAEREAYTSAGWYQVGTRACSRWRSARRPFWQFRGTLVSYCIF